MVVTPVKSLTLESFLALPETKPASEYIDGKIVQKPMPQGKHSLLQLELISFINSILRKASIAIAFPELRCSFGGRSIVPDVVVLKIVPEFARVVKLTAGDVFGWLKVG